MDNSKFKARFMTLEEFFERWRQAQEELAAMTQEQRVEFVRAALETDEEVPF